MKKLFVTLSLLVVSIGSFAQVAYFQYRVVPEDREQEFVEKETKYWSKVAKAAIDKGQMAGWSLWRKVGVTEAGAPNYVFVNTFESLDKVDQAAVWSDANLNAMGVSPEMVVTSSFAPVPFDYWMQLEDQIEGEYKFAVVNYAMPDDLGAFIRENKELWKPFHQQNITAGNMNMKSWGMLSVIYPRGNMARFSVLTWDGFDTMNDALNYLRYQNVDEMQGNWEEILSKTKMGEINPDGFNYSIIYELVMRVAPQ